MRAFAIFVGLIALGLAGIAILGYPAWLVISPWLDNPKFHRISSRVGMGLLVIGFIFVARRLKIGDRQSMGFGLPWQEFIAVVGKSVFFGALLMMPAVVTMIAFDLLKPAVKPHGDWINLVLGGIVTGLTVSFIEETFLRGAMLTAIKRESGAWAAIVLTALVYAATHFLGRYRVAAANVNADSGFDMLAHTLALFGQPLLIMDTFLCLFAVGVLLGMVRVRTGNIAATIGLHTGWVAVIYVVREVTDRRADAPGAWLLGTVGGFMGWLVLAWTLVLGAALVWWYRPGVVPGRDSRDSLNVTAKDLGANHENRDPAPPLTPSQQSADS
jgi:membrane protease YdiL (CAAX protease family)